MVYTTDECLNLLADSSEARLMSIASVKAWNKFILLTSPSVRCAFAKLVLVCTNGLAFQLFLVTLISCCCRE